MRIRDGPQITFLGDSITEHSVAVSDDMEAQSQDLPALGALARVDRHQPRGWMRRTFCGYQTGFVRSPRRRWSSRDPAKDRVADQAVRCQAQRLSLLSRAADE